MYEGEALVQLIGNFGFPIAVTIYLLHRFERKIEALESAISSLADVFEKKSHKSEVAMSDKEMIKIIELLEPKIKKVLLQTNIHDRDDLEQDLLELIIKKIRSNDIKDVPGFFDFINQQQKLAENKPQST